MNFMVPDLTWAVDSSTGHEIPFSHGIQVFIAEFTVSHHSTLSWLISILFLFRIYFNSILSASMSSKWSVPIGFRNENFYALFVFPVPVRFISRWWTKTYELCCHRDNEFR